MTIAWHFVRSDRRLRTGELVEAGRTYTAEGELELCRNGLHASERALDALKYAPGAWVCRVELRGEMLRDFDKACARERHVLWLADATHVLHEFACWCAEQALALLPDPDPRSVAAIETKRRWLRGEATIEELDAARAAAWYAKDDARAAAWAVARAAAIDAAIDAAGAAKDAARAAWAAARAAAWAVARAAAIDAAIDAAGAAKDAARAAWAAARAADWAAARAAARERQNVQLEQMLEGLAALERKETHV